MISLYASGGLGNQLFNYAAARTLADRTGVALVIDAGEYADQWGPDAVRSHVLHRFPVRAKFRNLGRRSAPKPLPSRIMRRLREDALATVVERPLYEIGYFRAFEELGRRTVLKGHFISPRFFAGNETRIRMDLTPDTGVLEADAVAIAVLAEMESRGTPVAVHVRRGDLLRPELAWLMLPDPETYYRRALERMAERLAEPVFWVFSDDGDWCRTTFARFPFAMRIVDLLPDGRRNPIKEFLLMSRCHSFVMANSAFSWWGAWLGTGEGKHVIAPFRWDNRDLVDMNDLIPAEWERISW
jgi:hypothetical protein